jgi:succinoglycan biosynthesis protein ExoA
MEVDAVTTAQPPVERPAVSTAFPFVSVLLPVRGESHELAECLASLARQTYPRDRFEVLIADASDRPIDPAILPHGIDVHVYPNEARVMSPGLNMAAGHARGEYLAIVSAHSYLPDAYFERMLATARATGAANVGTRVRKVAGSAWGLAIAAATSSPFGVGSSIQHHGAEAGPADSAFPGFIARPMFEKLGGFNAALACNEDDEFNARVRAAGGLVWYEPAVTVAYRPRETLLGLYRQHFRYGRWKVAVARLGVPGYLRPRHAIPSLVVVGAVGGPLLSVLWRPFAIPTALAALAYLALALVEGRRMGRRHGAATWRTALVFPVVHAGYGIGFLRGLLDRGLPREG